MYCGNSGCYGIILYDTDIKGDNAVYGYYSGSEIRLETGTAEAMKAVREGQEKGVSDVADTVKTMAKVLFLYLAMVILAFVLLPLKMAVALLIFCVVSCFPLMIITVARTGMYKDAELREQFRRYHGCEHEALKVLTNNEPAEVDSFCGRRIYDAECGTAYSGYAIVIALEIALMVIFWPGLLKAAGILLLTGIILLVLILVPRINPFMLLQRPVVLSPTEKEYLLAIEIIKKLRELK